MATRTMKPSPVTAAAYLIGILLLNTGIWSASAAPLVIYSESYIVRYQEATCSTTGELVFLGPDSPVVLSGNSAFQVETSTVSTVRFQYIWNQNLITDNPPRYQVLQTGDGTEPSQNCWTVDADANPGTVVANDICLTTSSTLQQFEYTLVRNAPGCATTNENGFAVTIKPTAAVDVGNNLCVSASATPGVLVTVETCNEADDSQVFFVNVPSIVTQG